MIVRYDGFELMRMSGHVYVDKTKQILDIINAGKYVCLSRPVGFGKTLLLDIVQILFSGQTLQVDEFKPKRGDLFRGLYIYDKWDFSKEFPVVNISEDIIDYFYKERRKDSKHNRKFKFNKYMIEKLRDIAYRNNLVLKGRTLTEKISNLVECLGKKIVILIDADGLLRISNSFLNRNIIKDEGAIFSEILDTIKEHDKYIHFAFMIGQYPNKLTEYFMDLTFDERAGSVLGFTQRELEENFSEYIDARAARDRLSRKDLLEKINSWYGGYSWDGKTRVCHSDSIFELFNNYDRVHNFYVLDFEHLQGEQVDLMGWCLYYSERNRKNNIYYEGEIVDSKSLMICNTDPKVYKNDKNAAMALLIQTGGLTIKEKIDDGPNTRYLLDIPNWSMRFALKSNFIKGGSPVDELDNPFPEEKKRVEDLGPKIIRAALDENAWDFSYTLIEISMQILTVASKRIPSMMKGGADDLRGRVELFNIALREAIEGSGIGIIMFRYDDLHHPNPVLKSCFIWSHVNKEYIVEIRYVGAYPVKADEKTGELINIIDEQTKACVFEEMNKILNAKVSKRNCIDYKLKYLTSLEVNMENDEDSKMKYINACKNKETFLVRTVIDITALQAKTKFIKLWSKDKDGVASYLRQGSKEPPIKIWEATFGKI
jgi:hypothetical protein